MEYLKHLNNDEYEVKVRGKITFSDHLDFKNLLLSVNDNNCKKMVLDLNEVDFVDSAALGMMLLLKDETEKNRIHLTIKHANGQVKKMLQISRFYELFNIEE